MLYVTFGYLMALNALLLIFHFVYIAMTPPLSTPLALDNCGQSNRWRVFDFSLGNPPEGL